MADDAWWDMKQNGYATGRVRLPADPHAQEHRRRHDPGRVSPRSRLRLIWHIWWLAILASPALIVVAITHTFNENRDFYVEAPPWPGWASPC
jgi:cytochrome o ubiquinol oxidase subunit 1